MLYLSVASKIHQFIFLNNNQIILSKKYTGERYTCCEYPAIKRNYVNQTDTPSLVMIIAYLCCIGGTVTTVILSKIMFTIWEIALYKFSNLYFYLLVLTKEIDNIENVRF